MNGIIFTSWYDTLGPATLSNCHLKITTYGAILTYERYPFAMVQPKPQLPLSLHCSQLGTEWEYKERRYLSKRCSTLLIIFQDKLQSYILNQTLLVLNQTWCAHTFYINFILGIPRGILSEIILHYQTQRRRTESYNIRWELLTYLILYLRCVFNNKSFKLIVVKNMKKWVVILFSFGRPQLSVQGLLLNITVKHTFWWKQVQMWTLPGLMEQGVERIKAYINWIQCNLTAGYIGREFS